MIRSSNENLSKRELEVLSLIAAGLTNRQIAKHIIVETGTVKRHVHNILGKLNARSRNEAVERARTLQPVSYPTPSSTSGAFVYQDQLWW